MVSLKYASLFSEKGTEDTYGKSHERAGSAAI